MDINNKARIHWACRRGMRELDISIMPFFEHEYDTLSDDDKRLFIRLLENDDPDLFNWLMNHGEPADAELQRMVKLIQTRNRERGPVAMRFTHRVASALVLSVDARRGGGAGAGVALAAELYPAVADTAVAGGVRLRAQPAADPCPTGGNNAAD